VLCGVLVAAGTALARLPVDPMYGKVLLAGAAAGCAVEVMQLVAMVSSENLFFNPRWEQALRGGGFLCMALCRASDFRFQTMPRGWRWHMFKIAGRGRYVGHPSLTCIDCSVVHPPNCSVDGWMNLALSHDVPGSPCPSCWCLAVVPVGQLVCCTKTDRLGRPT